MRYTTVTPILNVSDVPASFAWFRKLGFDDHWEWCPPGATAPTFGGVRAGDVEIFLCLDGQGGRGEHGAWMSLWVDDVEAVHGRCVEHGIEVVTAPEDMPWDVREMQLFHPDGHTIRVSQSIHGH